MKKMSDERKKFVISELKALGLTFESIAKGLGVSRQRVEQMLNHHYESVFSFKPKNIKGRNILTLLISSNHTNIQKLAREIGISTTTLYNKTYNFQDGSGFHRKRYFSKPQAESVAKYFGVNLEDLFERIEVLKSKCGRKPLIKGDKK